MRLKGSFWGNITAQPEISDGRQFPELKKRINTKTQHTKIRL